MAITLVQGKETPPADFSFDSPPTPGNLLVVALFNGYTDSEFSGFTRRLVTYGDLTVGIFYRVATAAEPAIYDYTGSFGGAERAQYVAEFADDAGSAFSSTPVDVQDVAEATTTGTAHVEITTTSAQAAMTFALLYHHNALDMTPDDGAINVLFTGEPGAANRQLNIAWMAGAGTIGFTDDFANADFRMAVAAAFRLTSIAAPPPIEVLDPDLVALGTLDNATDVVVRVELNDNGAGQFRINRHDSQATSALLALGNWCQITIPAISPTALFIFAMESGDFDVLSADEQGAEDLEFRGRGGLAYWERAIWLPSSFTLPWWPSCLTGPPPAGARGAVSVAAGTYRSFTVVDNEITGVSDFTTTGFCSFFDRRRTFPWPGANPNGTDSQRFLVRLIASGQSGDAPGAIYFHPHQGGVTEYLKDVRVGDSIDLSAIGDGDKPGEVLRYIFDEAKDASRTVQPIEHMTADFTSTLDTDSAAWTTTDALKGLQVAPHEDLLSTVRKLVSTGVLDVEMGADLEMHAYNAPHGRDLTGAAFGPGVVRFEAGVNIADELRRESAENDQAVEPLPTYASIAGKDGVYAEATSADVLTAVPREVGLTAGTNNETALVAYGEAYLAWLRTRKVTARFRIVTGDDETAGRYMPGPPGTNGHFWIGDTVRVHTGTGVEDYNEDDLRVVAITISFDEAADVHEARTLVVIVECESLAIPPPAPPQQLPPADPSLANTSSGDQAEPTDHGSLTGLSDDDHTQYLKESTVDAKGDLIAGTADDTVGRLPVGIGTRFLLPDTGQATGLRWGLLHKLDATAAPTVNDDSGDGYEIGSRWLDVTNDKEYVCLDASSGAAAWVETTGAGGGATSLDGLSDVDLTGAADGDFLQRSAGVWVPVSAPSGTVPSGTAVGDILVWDGSAWAKLAKGSDGQVLTADAAQALDLKWATPSGGGGFPLDGLVGPDATYGDHFTGAALDAAWTRRNYTSGAETYQVGPDGTYLRIAKAGRSVGDGYFRAAPAGDWTFAMAYIPRFLGNQNSFAWGLGVVDTNGSGLATIIYNNPGTLLVASITTYTSYGGTFDSPGGDVTIWQARNAGYLAEERKVWVRLRKSGTTYYVTYSLDGEVWAPESSGIAWAGTVDRVAMMDGPLGTVTSGSGDGSYVDVDWFDKIA